MGDWDPVERVPLDAGQPVQKSVPFAPMAGPRNALAPSTMKVLATVPSRPRASSAIQWSDASPDLQARGISQVGSNGAYKYAPKGTGPANPDAAPKLTAQEQILLSKARNASDELNNMSSEMGRYARLNKDVDTGGILALPGVDAALAPFDSERSTMRSIVSKLTPAMRNGLPGAASDKDVEMFRNATVGADKPPQANAAIAQAAKAYAVRHSDHLAFLEAYARKNGSLLGASERWQEYVNTNPLYDDNAMENGVPKLNKVRPWRQVFTDLKPNTAPGGIPAGAKVSHYDPATGTFKEQ